VDILHQSLEGIHGRNGLEEHGQSRFTGERLDAALVGLQRRIEAIYQLEPTPDIGPFVQLEAAPAREQLIVRQSHGSLELVVLLPEACAEALVGEGPDAELDAYLGAVEGISHFVHLADRARTQLPTTLLELELQAEVDKFAVLARDLHASPSRELTHLHRRLYEDVSYLHAESSERGERYRFANDLAARLWSQLLRGVFSGQAESGVLEVLRRFYRASQAEKIRIARAA
jgi:hypothetical protein